MLLTLYLQEVMMKNMNSSNPSLLFRESYTNEWIERSLGQCLYSTLLSKYPLYDIVLVCIGTDRSTGDALGPLVGTALAKQKPSAFTVYGTLDKPVHAVNLEQTLLKIQETHRFPFIIALDACLGDFKSVGKISIVEGPLKPGAGVQKKLPDVGDIHLTGIVNVGGFMEYFVLQNTRLALVMNMAEKIAAGISQASMLLTEKREAPIHQNVRSSFHDLPLT